MITTFDTRDGLMAAAADRIADALRQGIAGRGSACAALSGGATPEPAYALLVGRALDWSKVTFALVDERFVPPDHPASNEGMLRRALAPVLAQGAQLLPMFSPAPDVREAARRADALYASLEVDVAVMGMGEDGHTASWFPGAAGVAEALDRSNPHTVAALYAPQAAGSADRLSLTRSAVARASRVLLLILGEAKRARLEEALAHSTDVPVAALFNGMSPPEVLWTP